MADNNQNPKTAEEFFKRASVRFAEDDFDGTIADLNEVIRLQPEQASAWNNRGNAKSDKGDHDGAIADYSEAIRLQPDNAGYWNNRGLAKHAKGDHDGAISDYSKAIHLQPELVIAWSNRGAAKRKKGDHDGAIADCNEAIRLQPDFAEAWGNRGNAKSEKGDHDGAIADYSEAIRLQPDYAGYWNNRGGAKHAKGDHDGAITDLSEAIRLQPNHADAWTNRGGAWIGKQEYDKAIADCEQAIRLDPNNKKAFHNRAIAMALKNSEEVKAQLQKEYSEKLEQAIRASVGQMEEDAGGFRKSYRWHLRGAWICNGAAGLVLLLIFIGILYAFVTIFSVEADIINSQGNWGNWRLLPWVPPMAIALAPLFLLWWMLQKLSTELKILAYGFQRKALIEERMLLYFRNDQATLKELQKVYLAHWMDKGMSEEIRAAAGKGKDGDAPSRSIMDMLRGIVIPRGKDGEG